jgi:hypothetical protein
VNEAKSEPATVQGSAGVIRKGQAVEAQPAVLRMTVEIKRAATGMTEVYELVGTQLKEES